MSQKQQQKKKNDAENNKDEGKKKKEEKETPPPTTVVLKVDMHCDGCASKIVQCIRGFEALKLNLLVEGVESLKADRDAGKLTITGNVDPAKLRDKLAQKMKKKVDLISPLPNKDKENKSQNQNKNKPDDKKPKEPPVTTAVLKVALHCQGCIERICKTVLKTKGVYDLAIDKEKEMVTVKGTMDVNALVEKLTDRLKRKVELVPPKKEKKESEKDKEKEREGDAAEKKGDSGGGAKKKKQKGGDGGGGGGENKKDEDGGDNGKGSKMEQSKMQVLAPACGCAYGYGYGYGDGGHYGQVQLHAPQFFSDENPNACSVM